MPQAVLVEIVWLLWRQLKHVSICSGRDSSKAATEALQISAFSASKHLIASGESGKEVLFKMG